MEVFELLMNIPTLHILDYLQSVLFVSHIKKPNYIIKVVMLFIAKLLLGYWKKEIRLVKSSVVFFKGGRMKILLKSWRTFKK